METIQVVLDKDLLRAADKAAKRAKVNRSTLIRDALREHLKWLRTDELEMRDRRGFEQLPNSANELAIWEQVAAWPED
jgi:metal-responsive CopG/Arc/MetJ family transcriptional regulator